ncbi:hypothetical protein QTP86_025440 [Hemibagrus guttatus]|nr:hypothetical protein QTP86_025440 [Hemibagrus guttatus]
MKLPTKTPLCTALPSSSHLFFYEKLVSFLKTKNPKMHSDWMKQNRRLVARTSFFLNKKERTHHCKE